VNESDVCDVSARSSHGAGPDGPTARRHRTRYPARSVIGVPSALVVTADHDTYTAAYPVSPDSSGNHSELATTPVGAAGATVSSSGGGTDVPAAASPPCKAFNRRYSRVTRSAIRSFRVTAPVTPPTSCDSTHCTTRTRSGVAPVTSEYSQSPMRNPDTGAGWSDPNTRPWVSSSTPCLTVSNAFPT
jgi:hypothetical protein